MKLAVRLMQHIRLLLLLRIKGVAGAEVELEMAIFGVVVVSGGGGALVIARGRYARSVAVQYSRRMGVEMMMVMMLVMLWLMLHDLRVEWNVGVGLQRVHLRHGNLPGRRSIRRGPPRDHWSSFASHSSGRATNGGSVRGGL